MLVLRESHSVVGRREEEFEATLRDEWWPALSAGDDARLLYAFHQAHGGGESYVVVTYTAFRSGAAWEALARRVDAGDLRARAVGLDGLRHDVESRFLIPLPWSPFRSFDPDAVPTRAADHEPSVFMEDTIRPDPGQVEAYIELAGRQYATGAAYDASFPDTPRLLDVQATFRAPFGAPRRREITYLQKVLDPQGLLRLFTDEMPREFSQPGRYMHDALAFRDQWRSRLLRTTRWSPVF